MTDERALKNQLIERLIGQVHSSSPVLGWTKAGLTPPEIKRGVAQILSPYVDDLNEIDDLLINVLVPDAVRVVRLEGHPLGKSALDFSSRLYRAALLLDEHATIDVLKQWHVSIFDGVSEFWNLFHASRPLSHLTLDLFKDEMGRGLGVLIEAALQPLLREGLSLLRITNGVGNTSTIADLDLGVIVNELHEKTGHPGLFHPPPWNIGLHQWRNMAQHHGFRVVGPTIVGTYRTGPKGKAVQRSVTLSREQMADVVRDVGMIRDGMDSGRTLALASRRDVLVGALPDIAMREETHVLHTVTAIASQGFELSSLHLTDDGVAKAVVRDITLGDFKSRAAHAMQFAYPIWLDFETEMVELKITDAEGKANIVVRTKGTDCAAVRDGALSFDELAVRAIIQG